jgi:hypothetical protein
MSLILPKSMQGNQRHPVLATPKQFYSPKDITGTSATVADIVAELQPVARNEALRWICALSMAILLDDGMTAKVQLRWAREFFANELADHLEATMKSDGVDAGLIFHRRGIWFVLQMALLACRDTESEMTNAEVASHVGRACFIANDIVNDIEAEAQAALPQDDLTKWMVTAIIPMLGIDGRVNLNFIGRAIAIWEEAARSPAFHEALKSGSTRFYVRV